MEIVITIKDERQINDVCPKDTKVEGSTDAEKENSYSMYARFFDESCPAWSKDAEWNLMFLRMIQNHCNDCLKTRGHLFLNEVYDDLGIPRTKAGQVVGWIYDPNNPVGDNYVDFGIFDADKKPNREFVNGTRNTILLDFNVDGLMIDKVDLKDN